MAVVMQGGDRKDGANQRKEQNDPAYHKRQRMTGANAPNANSTQNSTTTGGS